MPNKVDYRTFSQRVKNKYPEYINMGDLELAQMWVEQNPQYGEFVMFDQQPVKKKDQAAPSLGAQGGLPSQQPSVQPRKAKEERFFGGAFGNLLDALDMPTPGVPGSGLGIGDFIDDMGRAFSSGKKAGVNISTSRPLFFSGPGSSDEEVQNFVKAGTEYTGPSDEATQFYKDYEDSGKTTFGFVKALAKNPGVAPELVVQSASQFLFNPEARAAFGTAIAAGAGIGAVASAPLGGIGAAPGAIAAILPGVAAANTAVSTLSSFSELMKQELDQRGLEFNEDNVRTILEDEKALRKIRAKSAGYGITIGAFDLATAKVGGAIAAKIPMTTRAGKIKSTLATTGVEAVGGSAGEAAARGVTGQELDPAEIGLEGIAEIPGAAPTLLSQVLKRPTYKINGEFVGQADVDDILQNSTRQELENTKFEVFNDVNMYGSKFRNRLEELGLLEEIIEANPNAQEADINRLFELNSKLKKVENLNSESAKASANWLRSQIKEVQDGLLTQEFAPQVAQQAEEAAPEAPQMAPAEVSPEVGMEIPQEDQGVLQVINSVIQPISSDLEARMNNAEEIPMSEIEAVVDALIDAQQSVRSQEGARTRQTQGGFVTEFGALSDQQKRNFDTLIEQQINKLLNYEFATITTTEQAGEKTKTAGLVATPREGRPLPESVVSRDRFDGAGVRIGGRGAGRITVKKIPGFGGRSVYGVSFGNRKGVAPVEDLEFDNLEFVAPEILADGSFNARVKDSKSGLEFTITDPELSIDLAIAAQLKEAGRKEFPQPAFLEAVREVTQGQPTQVTTFPNLGRTGTTPAAVGVEPQTEQDVRQETNAPQEGRGQGEDAAPVPQEEGRQEGQITPSAVAQEGETPPAAKRTRKTKQQIADESNAALEELKKTIGVLQASKKKPLFQRPGQKAEIDEDTQIELASEEAGISPKNFRDLYRVNRELFGLNQSEAMSAAIAMDKMIDVMAKRAGVSKTEMYGRLNFKKSTEQDLPQSAIRQDKEEILRVFHGTSKDKDFKKFKDTGKGVFVTISPKEASEYAEQNDSMKFGDYDPITRKFREINTASRVIPMNLNLGNSYKLTKVDIEFLNSRPNYSALQKELHARIKANGFDTIDYGNGVYAVLTEGRLRSMLTNEVLFQKDLPQGIKFQVDAWHGSPYQFDKFKTENIGTGEGAQAFGWGLYFTDLESIARNYAKRLSGDVYSYDGKLISKEANDYLFLADDSLGDNFNENTIRDIAKVAINKIRKEYIPDLKEVAKTSPSEKQRSNIPNEVKRLEGVIKELENIISSKEIKLEKNKILYKASINKGKTPDQYTWVEWDKPVGEENAKRILAQLKKEGLLEKAETNWSRKNMSGSFSGKESLENDLKNLRGDHLYERFLSPRVTPVADGLGTSAINRLFGSAKDASLFLLRSGIDGNKYPAESIARGATSDTARGFNYVVFDENAVSIEEVIKFQEDAVKARGAMMITLDGQATIYALTDPNVSTPLHELTHVFEHYLTDEEKATVQEWAKTKDWTIKTSEAFARGFEKYLAEGKAPTPALQKIFDNFKQWLTDIYRGIVGSDIDIELNEPMRDLYAKMFEFTGEDGPSNFEKWKGDNKLLVGPDIQDAKTGEPIVVRAYHGTTNEFYEFDSSVKGSVEGHLGKINYFTSDYQDAAINYLSEGTDLTNRVEGRTDQIMSELENNYDDYYESIPELSRKYGYTEEELQDDFVSFRSLARDLAKKELYGGTNKVLDVFIKLNNPVVLGKGSTWFQTLNISEADFDQAAQEIADENDISVEEAKQDYDFDIRDRAIENAGYENLAVEALDSALRSNGYRGASASEILGDNLYESDIDLNRLEKELRQNDKAGLFENEEGEFASSQVVSDFLKNLGFDGIILTDVSSRFRGMGLGSLTSHIHVFDEFANQIKLADGSNTTFGETRDIRFQLDDGKSQQQAQPEAKVEATAKTIAEQRKEFRETAKKYFDGLKKMGIAFDPERNSKEDIAFLKALAKYIKLELDAGMVTFKGFLEKTSNLIEEFNEKAVVSAAKEAWAKEVVKAYPKLYVKYSAAKRKELEREIKDIKKTMIRKIREMTDPKIVNFKSQLKTEKRRLSKEAAAQLAAIRNAYDVKTMMAMEPQDLMELLNLTEGIYKEGRSEIKALNESLDEAAQIQGEEMLAAVTSKDKRLDKLSDKEAARRKLKFKSGVVVAVNNDERVMLKEEAELDALTGEGYNFFFLNTTGDKVVNRGFLDSVASFFSGKLRTINENARDLRTALELIKSKSKESQDFINGLVAKMNKASVTKARKSEEWSSILKDERTKFFGPDIKFGYTNWMNAIAKVDGKALELIDGRGEPIGPINNGKIVSLYRQLMDPTNLIKTDNVRKINLSDESIQSIIDYMNLPANKPGKDFALSLTKFFLQVAKDTKAVLENNGYNSTKLDEKRYNKEDFEGDEFIGQVMGQLADTRTEGFVPYTPIQATESPDAIQGVEINEDDLFDSADLQKNFSVISNNMITRRPGGVIVPTDIRQTLNAYTAGMANMNAKLPLLRETQSVFSKRNLTAMSNAFAPQFTENLKANYISFMTDRVTPVVSNKTESAIKTWLMTSTAIPMFLNFKSSILQMLASPNFMVSYDFPKYIDASKKLFRDPALSKKIFTEIIDLPTVRQRFGGRFSPDSRIISEEVGRYGKLAINIPFTNISISAKEILSKGYIFSSIGDVLSIAIGGAPIYYDISETNKRKYMSEGMGALEADSKAKKDAEEKLFEIIQETQQSSEAMYLSEFQKQSITRIFSSFATATMQYYRKARRAASRMKNKEGNQLQNAYEILHYTTINAAVFQFFSSMLMDAVSGPGEDELEEMSRQERMDFVRYMEDVMATVAQGTGALGVALQALILAYKESEKSGKPEKIVESALRTMPAVRMKYDAAINTLREWKRGDYVRSLTKGAELANIPADRIRSLGLQVSDALMENLDAQERIARLMGFRTESWMREKKQGEIWNGVQSTIDKSTPAERQRAISNTKSAYRDLFQLYGKRYAEATTETEKARVDSIASKELLNVYNHRQGGPELTEELQKLFNQSAEFNSLPKDLQKLKNMETNRKIGDVVEEVLSLEKKSEKKAMEYWSSLVNNGILSDKEIDRIREEYNTRKGLQ